MDKIKKILKDRYVNEAVGAAILIAILVLSVLALTIGPVFLKEHAVVIVVLLILIIVISGAV